MILFIPLLYSCMSSGNPAEDIANVVKSEAAEPVWQEAEAEAVFLDPARPFEGAPEAVLSGKVLFSGDSGAVDRTLFSLVNMQSIYDQGEPVTQLILESLNLEGSMQRVSTSPHLFESENDNNDPFDINWEGFDTDKLINSVNYKPEEMIDKIIEGGMEPVLLLAYNMPWLAADGSLTGSPESADEWAEMASAALYYLNKDKKRIRYIEIWNEPDGNYYKGSPSDFFELFNTVAGRIHRDHPGVLVGGPAAINYTGNWSLNFIRNCGDSMDYFIYHSYNETVEFLTERLDRMYQYIKDTTGRNDIFIMITESDNYQLHGGDKLEYLIRRQIALQDRKGFLEGFHHFQAAGYDEGESRFGIAYLKGNLVEDNYWPYWLFRDLEGERGSVQWDDAAEAGKILTIASESADSVNALVYVPSEYEKKRVDLELELPVPAGFEKGVLTVSTAGPAYKGVLSSRVVTGGEPLRVKLEAVPGTAYSVTVKAENSRDLVWGKLLLDRSEGLVGETIEAKVRVMNTSASELSVKSLLVGIPQKWKYRVTGGNSSFTFLPGQTAEITFEIDASSPTPRGGSAVYAYFSVKKPGERNAKQASLPATVEMLSPVLIEPKPGRLNVSDGYKTDYAVEFVNTFSAAISGVVSLNMPEGVEVGHNDIEVEIPVGESLVVRWPLKVSSAPEGESAGTVRFDYEGILFEENITVVKGSFPVGRNSVPVDLDEYYNADGVTFSPDFDDYTQFGGPFTMAGRFMPLSGANNFAGIDFIIPDMSRGKMNLVGGRGQEISVNPGNYRGLAILTTTVNSNKSEILTLKYSDGSTEALDVKLTDWCVNPKFGETVVMKAPYRHITTGVLEDASPQLFYLEFPVDRARKLEAVIMPDNRELFIMSLSLIK